MNKIVARSKLVFGAFVMFASVFSSGCASSPPQMAIHDLEYFQIDCRIKEQQIKFLQSLRTGRDAQMSAGLQNVATPWTMFTNFPDYRQRLSTSNGYTNWNINQLLLRLRYDC